MQDGTVQKCTFNTLIKAAFSFMPAMPRNPDKEPFSGQLPKAENDLLMLESNKKEWSKAKMIQKIIRYWLGKKGLMPEIEIP